MAEYKCVCCNHTMEAEEVCICPKCGYKMFPVPYDKDEILRGEIKRFFSALRLDKVDITEFNFTRKENKEDFTLATDKLRFPSYSEITEFITSAQRIEGFFERGHKSIEQIRQHYKKSFNASYSANLNDIKDNATRFDYVLNKALDVLSL
ncbi:MAG: hypothetical protein HUJ56_08455, partial [Erysipelotrichaceae bacterium]|nr:hypothetical protein [Erysipelotrichaceae bacterium]